MLRTDSAAKGALTLRPKPASMRPRGQVAWQRHELDQNVAATFQIVTATSGGGCHDLAAT